LDCGADDLMTKKRKRKKEKGAISIGAGDNRCDDLVVAVAARKDLCIFIYFFVTCAIESFE
jgi:hypothetical protein